MTHDAAFLQSIIETPDDDAPRLIYADWLEDHGQTERAEFIRIQCEIPKLTFSDSILIGFDRGFIGKILITSPKAFLAHAEDIFSLAPIRQIILSPGPEPFESIAQLVDCPYLSRVECLDLQCSMYCVTDDHFRTLATWANLLRRLTGLQVDECEITEVGFGSLFRSPELQQLRELKILSTPFRGRDALGMLANSLQLLSLVTLHYRGVISSGEELLSLIDSPNWSRLETLELDGNRIGNAGALILAETTKLPRLKSLGLRDNQIGSRGAEALACSPNLAGLEILDLSGNVIGFRGAKALARSPHGSRLKRLDLGGNGLDLPAEELLMNRFGDRITTSPFADQFCGPLPLPKDLTS